MKTIPTYSSVEAYLEPSRVSLWDPDVTARVTEIVNEVRTRGDEAVLQFTEELDGTRRESLTVTDREWDSAKEIPTDVTDLLKRARDNIRHFHQEEKQGLTSWDLAAGDGYVGQRVSPLKRAGLYVPGGTAAYPSSVLMNAIPAQVAGVSEIAIVSPPNRNTGRVSPLVLAAAEILNIREVYAMGGAQAVAALAWGTESVSPVDKITGPGNQWVTEAKRQVFGRCGIDSLAGPSEIVIVADESADPACLAADLLSQAEHDVLARAVLITWDDSILRKTAEELDRQASTLPREAITRKAFEKGALIRVSGLDEAIASVNAIAPEHLELQIRDPETILPDVIAGAVFAGPDTPEPVGDYWAGCNHILPTSGTARFASALSVRDFMRWTSVMRYQRSDLLRSSEAIARLARMEGLEAHARAVEIRNQKSEIRNEKQVIGRSV